MSSRVANGDAFVDRMPGFLYCGAREAQLVRDVLIGSAQERGQQQTLLAGAETEARRLVQKESARPSSPTSGCQLAGQTCHVGLANEFVGRPVPRLSVLPISAGVALLRRAGEVCEAMGLISDCDLRSDAWVVLPGVSAY